MMSYSLRSTNEKPLRIRFGKCCCALNHSRVHNRHLSRPIASSLANQASPLSHRGLLHFSGLADFFTVSTDRSRNSFTAFTASMFWIRSGSSIALIASTEGYSRQHGLRKAAAGRTQGKERRQRVKTTPSTCHGQENYNAVLRTRAIGRLSVP